MPLMRFKKIFDADAVHPQEYLSRYSRAAVIDSLNTVDGTCVLRWLDNPGGRQDVVLLQGSWGEYNMPVVGALVVCQFDGHDRPRIVRYANMNQRQRVLTPDEGGLGTLPKLKPGEKYWESSGGAYVYMTDGGKIVLASAAEDSIELDPDLQQIKNKSTQWQTVTPAGTQSAGLVRRWLPTTGNNEVVTDGLPTPAAGTPLTELVVSVVDKQQGVLPATPVFKMTLGTVVDDLGNIVDKKSLPQTVSTKQLAVRIVLASGVQLDIDKSGRVSLKNVRLNINEGSTDLADPDIALGLEVNNSALGTDGQHVARQHDTVVVPCSAAYDDPKNARLAAAGGTNLSFLQQLASALICGSPGEPCTLNPAMLTSGAKLVGEITSGAPNVILGDA